MSLNWLIDELATVALTEYASETRFRAMSARGSKAAALLFWLSSTERFRRLDLPELDLPENDTAVPMCPR